VPALSCVTSLTDQTELELNFNPEPILVTTELDAKENVHCHARPFPEAPERACPTRWQIQLTVA
jgi:hypothetical protein